MASASNTISILQRYGVFGGTFDPPHYGHLALAETARVQLGLARVLFAPAGAPPHKRQDHLTPPEARAAMVEAAIADNPAFALARVDLERPGPHYTFELLTLLRAQYPTVEEWFFLMGEDSLRDFAAWVQPEAILAQATLAVMPRADKPVDAKLLIMSFPALRERLVWLDAPLIHISATELRRRARAGLSLRYLTPDAVATYIHEHGLYERCASKM